MRLLHRLLAAACLFALAGCASAPPPAPAQSAPEVSDDASLYGLFLAGHAALDQNQSRMAAEYFAKAAQAAPDAVGLKEEAFLAALAAGDVHGAAMLATDLPAANLGVQRLGKLTRAVNDLAEGDGHGAVQALGTEPLGPPHRAAGLLLKPWLQAAAGDWKSALTLPDARGDLLLADISKIDQAILYEKSRRNHKAEGVLRSLTARPGAPSTDSLMLGQFLERRGRGAEAKALYTTALQADPDNHQIETALARVVAGGPPPPEPSLAQGAAQALLIPAAIDLAEHQSQYGLDYLQLILRLDPNRGEAWVLLGDLYAEAGDLPSARAAYQHPAPGSDDFVLARGRLMLTYQQDSHDGRAVEIARDTVRSAPNDNEALEQLSDALSIDEKYAESAQVLDTLIGRLGDQAGWQLYYARGVALSQADRWLDAEKDLQKALQLKPDDPDLQNYLGYSWVDRGEHMKQARELIEKAAAAKPDSGAIIDSLGWVYFKQGDYKSAVEQLERAATLEAADPDINNHLGDAYWRAGRKVEAGFQWRKVLTLEPSDKLRAEVEAKLKDGLDAPKLDAAKPAVAA